MRTVDGSKWRLLLELGVAGALLSVATALPAAELMVRGPDACPDATRMYRPHAAREDLFPAFRDVVGRAACRELGKAVRALVHD
ncbi:MAG: hypothetical protein ABI895_08275 [Deltaproteobacteria bacterium]